ncbi:MAG: CopG family transcriptional regulator [Treponema sp.]|nr:CopG family transcriptional regulator [Treponema sp.]
MATITIRIDETEKEALQKIAKENDMSVSQIVRRAIKEFLMTDRVTKKLNENPN